MLVSLRGQMVKGSEKRRKEAWDFFSLKTIVGGK